MLKEIAQDYPSIIEYERLGHPDQEKPPILEVNPSSYNPMWVLVNMLESDPNSNLVRIGPRENRQHVSVLILPDGIKVIDNAWANPGFKVLSRAYYSSFYDHAPRLRHSEEAFKNTDLRLYGLQSTEAMLPTLGLINNLVGNIVNGIKSGKI